MLTKGKPANIDEDLYAFLKAATWPDMIRSPGSKLHAEHRVFSLPLLLQAKALSLKEAYAN